MPSASCTNLAPYALYLPLALHPLLSPCIDFNGQELFDVIAGIELTAPPTEASSREQGPSSTLSATSRHLHTLLLSTLLDHLLHSYTRVGGEVVSRLPKRRRTNEDDLVDSRESCRSGILPLLPPGSWPAPESTRTPVAAAPRMPTSTIPPPPPRPMQRLVHLLACFRKSLTVAPDPSPCQVDGEGEGCDPWNCMEDMLVLFQCFELLLYASDAFISGARSGILCDVGPGMDGGPSPEVSEADERLVAEAVHSLREFVPLLSRRTGDNHIDQASLTACHPSRRL